MSQIAPILDQISHNIEAAENGDIEVIEAFKRMRILQKQLENAAGLIKDWTSENHELITDNIESYGKHYAGNEFSYTAGRTSFNFKGIAEVSAKEAELKALKERYKSYFKAAQAGQMPVDEDGVEIQLPTVNYSKGSITMKPASL